MNSSHSPLRQIRKQRGMTVEKLASLADLASATVYRAERGEQRATLETLSALAEALGVSVADLTHTPEAASNGEPCGKAITNPAPTDAGERSPVGA